MTNIGQKSENSSKRLKSATRYNQEAEADCDKQIRQKDEKVHQRLKMATRYSQETDCDRQTSIRIAFVQKFKLSNHEAIVD